MRAPPLNSLKVFSVVAEYESIAKAAQQLHLTESAVSRQIKKIELTLSVELFTRRNRRLYLTYSGLILQQACLKIFSHLDEAMKNIKTTSLDNHLVVSCEPTVTMHWLIPNLPKFQKIHPDISIHIYAAGGPIDLILNRTDLALRRNDFIWNQEYYSKKISDEYTGPVCKEEYWYQSQENLGRIDKIHSKTRIGAWDKWMDVTSKQFLSGSEMVVEHFYLSIQAAASGLGCAIGSIYMCHHEIESKRIIAPHGFIADGSEYHLLSETPIENDWRKQAFFEWIQGEFQILAKRCNK